MLFPIWQEAKGQDWGQKPDHSDEMSGDQPHHRRNRETSTSPQNRCRTFNNQNIPIGGHIVLNYVYVLYLSSEKSGELDFSTFLTMMHRQMQQEDPEAEIFEAFRMTDKQKRGFIQASELRAKLTTLGEKLTNKEGKMCWWAPAWEPEKNVPSVHPVIRWG